MQITAKRVQKIAEHKQTEDLRRTILVPEGAVDADKVSAVYENGLLTVTLPKREEAKPRKITVA